MVGLIAKGAFVRFGEEGFEGFLPVRRMRGWWELNELGTALEAEGGGRLRFGDPVRGGGGPRRSAARARRFDLHMKKLIPTTRPAVRCSPCPPRRRAPPTDARSGDVRASLTYNCGAGTYTCPAMRFRVRRGPGNNVVLDQQITLAGEPAVRPRPPGRQLGPLRQPGLRRRAGDPGRPLHRRRPLLPDVSFIYDYNGTSYNRIGRRLGPPGYVLTNIDRRERPEFRSGDKRFDDLYTSYAEIALPDPDLALPRRPAEDRHARVPQHRAPRPRRACCASTARIRRLKGDVRGALAAYQADNYLLSRRTAARGWRVLRGLRRARHRQHERTCARCSASCASSATPARPWPRRAESERPLRGTSPPTGRRAFATTCSRPGRPASSSRAPRSSRCATAASSSRTPTPTCATARSGCRTCTSPPTSPPRATTTSPSARASCCCTGARSSG